MYLVFFENVTIPTLNYVYCFKSRQIKVHWQTLFVFLSYYNAVAAAAAATLLWEQLFYTHETNRIKVQLFKTELDLLLYAREDIFLVKSTDFVNRIVSYRFLAIISLGLTTNVVVQIYLFSSRTCARERLFTILSSPSEYSI